MIFEGKSRLLHDFYSTHVPSLDLLATNFDNDCNLKNLERKFFESIKVSVANDIFGSFIISGPAHVAL